MRYRIGMAVVCLTALLAACGTTDVQSIQGSVERVGHQDGNFSQREMSFILLDGSDTTYECWVEQSPACALVQVGDSVELEVGHNQDYNIDNYVASLKIK
ncbi:MAG: hypothetical protein ACOH18_03255 [Candidatus Saccharimonadaceae bacterium]